MKILQRTNFACKSHGLCKYTKLFRENLYFSSHHNIGWSSLNFHIHINFHDQTLKILLINEFAYVFFLARNLWDKHIERKSHVYSNWKVIFNSFFWFWYISSSKYLVVWFTRISARLFWMKISKITWIEKHESRQLFLR